MHKMKKTVALTMAATMILASSVTAFADETSGSSTGAGTSEGHMNTHVIHVTLPTVDAGVTPFASLSYILEVNGGVLSSFVALWARTR